MKVVQASPDLVDLVRLKPCIGLSIAYATRNNFTGKIIYPEARAFLQRPVAEAVVRVHGQLAARGLGLAIYDAYRPWHVTRDFWNHYPQYRAYLADPVEGSRHNRGCAVDLTLMDLATGKLLPMPCEYDDFSEAAHPEYAGGTEATRSNRDLLRSSMEAEGFVVHPYEWWHYDHPDWARYPVMDLAFSDIH